MIKAKNQSGLTLVELMISMVIAGMLLGVMVMAFTAQSRTYNTQQEISALQEDMKAALQLMSRDIRMAGYDPTEATGFGITSATGPLVRMTADLNDSGGAPGAGETIAYSLTGTTLNRNDGGGDQPVIDNVTHLAFQYLVVRDNGTAMATREWWFTPPAGDLPNIRAVNVCIQGRTPRQTSTTQDTGTFTAAFKIPAEGAQDWTAAAVNWSPATAADRGTFQWRTMCVEVACRNLQ